MSTHEFRRLQSVSEEQCTTWAIVSIDHAAESLRAKEPRSQGKWMIALISCQRGLGVAAPAGAGQVAEEPAEAAERGAAGLQAPGGHSGNGTGLVPLSAVRQPDGAGVISVYVRTLCPIRCADAEARGDRRPVGAGP